MNTAFINLYAAKNIDYDGRTTEVEGYFSDFNKAKDAVGTFGRVERVNAVVIDGATYVLATGNPIDLDNVQKYKDEQLREETLAALTDEQKRVLGIT